MKISITSKQYTARVNGRDMTLFNQHSREWSNIYNHPVDPYDTLKTAGCGIFSICHAVEWMSGVILDPGELAQFSMNYGGRMYDGTNRPALLSAMQRSGLARKYGFSYSGSGPQNGAQELCSHIQSGGTALCNLRRGHIVCLVSARTQGGVKQLLAIDSHPTCASNAQYESIVEALDEAYICYETTNKSGVVTGFSTQASAFWVNADSPFDYDLLHRIN